MARNVLRETRSCGSNPCLWQNFEFLFVNTFYLAWILLSNSCLPECTLRKILIRTYCHKGTSACLPILPEITLLPEEGADSVFAPHSFPNLFPYAQSCQGDSRFALASQTGHTPIHLPRLQGKYLLTPLKQSKPYLHRSPE